MLGASQVSEEPRSIVDTSVWLEHFRVGSERLQGLLLDEQVLCHSLVVGELTCGILQKRTEILAMVKALPEVRLLDQEEMLSFLEARRVYSRGMGCWMHIGLPRDSRGRSLWTLNKPLRRTAASLDILV